MFTTIRTLRKKNAELREAKERLVAELEAQQLNCAHLWDRIQALEKRSKALEEKLTDRELHLEVTFPQIKTMEDENHG